MTSPTAGRTAAEPRSVRERRRRERRLLALGLALSALLHVLLIGIMGGLLDRSPAPEEVPAAPVVVEPPSGLRAVAVRPVEEEAGTDASEAVPRPPAAAPEVVRVPEVARTEETPERADDRTAAERLAPRLVDPRLWRPLVVMPREPTFEDVKARVAAAIELLSDSALAEAERAARAMDWTVKDAEGGRWGISPGQLHLGSITLPLPIMFPEDPEAAALQGEWHEIQGQHERAVLMESFEARVKAIRERRDRERADRRGSQATDPEG